MSEAPNWNPDRLNESRWRLDEHHAEQTRVYKARGIAAKFYHGFNDDQRRVRMNAEVRGMSAPFVELPSIDDPGVRLAVCWDGMTENGSIGLAMMWRTPRPGNAQPKFNMQKLDIACAASELTDIGFDFTEDDVEILINFAEEVQKLEIDGLIEDLDPSLLMIVDSHAPDTISGGLPHNSM